MNPSWIGVALSIVGALGGGTIAIFWLRNELRLASHSEAVRLAEIRRHHIVELEKSIEKMRTEMSSEIAELRGQVHALHEINAEKIASIVVARLVETPGITISVGP